MTIYSSHELLDIHYQTLAQQGESKARLIETAPGTPTDLMVLFNLARDLWRLLRPVTPAPAFRTGLGQQLMTEARRQQTQRALGVTPRAASRPRWVMPVTAIGTASLVGVGVGVGAYAFWRRSRQTAESDQPLAA